MAVLTSILDGIITPYASKTIHVGIHTNALVFIVQWTIVGRGDLAGAESGQVDPRWERPAASSYSRLFCTTGFIVEAGCYQLYQCNFKVGNLHLMKEKKVPQHHNSIKWVRQALVSTFGFWWLGSTNK